MKEGINVKISKSLTYAVVTLGVSMLFWIIAAFVNFPNVQLLALFGLCVSVILFICFLVMYVAQKISDKCSPYKIFAAADIIISAAITIYAIYDIKTDTGWFGGIVGTLLLVFIVPAALVLLIIDLILWAKNRNKKAINKESAEEMQCKKST